MAGPRALVLMYWGLGGGGYILYLVFVFQFHLCIFIFSSCLVS